MDKLKTSLALALLVASSQVRSTQVEEIDKMIERTRTNPICVNPRTTIDVEVCLEVMIDLQRVRWQEDQKAQQKAQQEAYEALPQAEKDRLAREKAVQDEQARVEHEKQVAKWEAEKRRVAKQQAEYKQWQAEEAEKERKIVAAARNREALHMNNRDMVGAQKRELESSLETLRTQYHQLEASYKQHPENEVLGRDAFELRKRIAVGQSLLDKIQTTYKRLSEPLLIDYLTPQAQKLARLKAQEEEIAAQRRELEAYLHPQAERTGGAVGEGTGQLKSQEKMAAPTGVGWKRTIIWTETETTEQKRATLKALEEKRRELEAETLRARRVLTSEGGCFFCSDPDFP